MPENTQTAILQHATLEGAGKRSVGESGIWVFLLLDMSIFAYMFAVFSYYRSANIELYTSSQNLLNPAYGLIYTALLLASSWYVVRAVQNLRQDSGAKAVGLINTAMLLGAGFIGLKLFEYSGKIGSGITPLTDEFFMFYFILTMAHLFHVSIGMFVLGFMKHKARGLNKAATGRDLAVFESAGAYWHMVDLLWVVLFAFFYLKG